MLDDYIDSGAGFDSTGFDLSSFLPDTTGAGFDFASFFPGASSAGIDAQVDAIDYSGFRDLTGPQLAELAASQDKNLQNTLRASIAAFGDKAGKFVKEFLFNKDGNLNLGGIGTAAAALYSLGKSKDSGGGYQKPVPKMEMVQEQIQYDDPNRRPGQGGRQYFTDPRFVTLGEDPAVNATALTAAKDASAAQATGLKAAYQKQATADVNPYKGKIPTTFNPAAVVVDPKATLPAVPSGVNEKGGLSLAKGGIASAGRYLQGKTDGMADKIPSKIDGKQPAALSHGEFVIPADVVSHLGNGNSDAGAQKLYQMMDRIRQARTGTKEQGKQINPDKFLMGGLASAYAGGGQVQKFNAGALVGASSDVSKANTLSPYVGEYATNALGQGAALANAPYQAYKGPLTAGASDLQQQAFAGASDLASAGYTPGSFTGGFGAAQATQYMNPYLQASLDPQLKELRRQSDIQRMEDAGRLTKAGAFGGGRQAVMESEGGRNLLDKQEEVIGRGYKSAYDTGLAQFNKERESDEASRQFSANFGLKSVDELAKLGETQRGITSEGLAADKAQFDKEREFKYAMPGYQLGLLQGLPIGTNTTSTNQDEFAKINTTLANLGVALRALGVNSGATTT
jgi:hypothetical protein